MIIFQKKKSGRAKDRKGVIADALKDAGYRSVLQACRACGASPGVVGAMLNGRSIFLECGGVNKDALRLAEALGETPERLFGQDAPLLPDDVVYADSVYDDAGSLIRAVLHTSLTDRERIVLTGIYFNELSLSELAESLNVTVQRIRQVRDKALRKLRWPTKLEKLAIAAESFRISLNEYRKAIAEREARKAKEAARQALLHPNR